MESIAYVGLDLHKRSISYCVKSADGHIDSEGTISAAPAAVEAWARGLDRPWIGALEATMFTGWVHDLLEKHASEVRVGHPAMLKAIAAGKKKNDQVDARLLADLLRCNLFPECYTAPTEMRNLRRVLRFRTMLVEVAVRMKNRLSGILMEVGAEYDSRRLHNKSYFPELLTELEEMPASVLDLLRINRGAVEYFDGLQRHLLQELSKHPHLQERVILLRSIPGIGQVGALTWALEIGDPHRFPAVENAVSYCGLCSAQDSSAGKDKRGAISKQRNKHLQTILIECAKLAPNYNEELARVRERSQSKSHRNYATIAVARKLVSYLLAVDKRGTPFVMPSTEDNGNGNNGNGKTKGKTQTKSKTKGKSKGKGKGNDAR